VGDTGRGVGVGTLGVGVGVAMAVAVGTGWLARGVAVAWEGMTVTVVGASVLVDTAAGGALMSKVGPSVGVGVAIAGW